MCTNEVTMRWYHHPIHGVPTMGLYLTLNNPWELRTVLKVSGRHHSPLFELWVLHPVWKALPANTDAFQDSTASQLVHDQVGVHHACQGGGHRIRDHDCTMAQATPCHSRLN